MKVVVQGGAKVNLTQREFLAEGGEGKIFVAGGTAYKIYADPSKMIPEGKIAELAAITDPRVIRPEKLVYDEKGRVLGFTSKFAPSGGVLCQVFTKGFRDRENISPTDMGALVLKLRSLVENVHRARVLLVDLNEMNFLLDPALKDVLAIDTASYQTPHFPATALMESVRDRHAKPLQFSELTDWFSFAVVSFRMFVGIHPYKGTHPTVKDMDERMIANLSVLNKDVKVPPACYPFTNIPLPYLDWYQGVFEGGKRIPPPTDFDGKAIIPVAVHLTVHSSSSLKIAELGEYDTDIVGVWERFGHVLVVTTQSIYLDGRRSGDAHKGTRGVGFTKSGHPVVASLDGDTPTLFDATLRSPVGVGLVGDSLMSYDGRLYLKNLDKIVQINLTEMGSSSQVVATSEVAVNVLEHATKLYDGVAIQNLLGATYVSVFPTQGASLQFRVPELDRAKIVDAKYDGGVLMVLAARKGTYDRYVFRVDSESEYDVRVVKDVTPSGLNFVTLDGPGICVCLTEESKLEVFSVQKGYSKINVVEDKALHGGMRLYKSGGKVVFATGTKLYSLSLR
jgi:hypothetical protein